MSPLDELLVDRYQLIAQIMAVGSSVCLGATKWKNALVTPVVRRGRFAAEMKKSSQKFH